MKPLKTVFVGTALILLPICIVFLYEAPWKNKNIGNLTDSSDKSSKHIFTAKVKPILDSRCVVCHGCYDAPCQLKLSSAAGLIRGATDKKVYDSSRLTDEDPTRLNVDATNKHEWREMGFHSIFGEQLGSKGDESFTVKDGIFQKILALKKSHPLPIEKDGRLSDTFDLSLNREWSCPTEDEFESYVEDTPHWGMPYALPALTEREYNILVEWAQNGAPMPNSTRPNNDVEETIATWESFLNNPTLKGKLVSRYIYEHLFLANIYFPEISKEHFYKIQRSFTPPGEPVKVIPTRRPIDDPGTETFYYRLSPVDASIVAKTHIPYPFDKQQLKRFRTLFYAPRYEVSSEVGYDHKDGINPFITFEQLPLESRYRFMLEQAQFTIRGFMKGTVCRGQVALNVIDDHFWVSFVSPKNSPLINDAEFIQKNAHLLSLPTYETSDLEPFNNWIEHSKNQKRYLKAKYDFLNRQFNKDTPLDMHYVWDGNGNNQNAALSVFRHFDSASVTKGFVGGEPKTMWLIDYPILERIHYLLVAGFDVYGNVGHQLLTRLYMDFLRMESELDFLNFLPENSHKEVANFWYRGTDEKVKSLVNGSHTNIYLESSLEFENEGHKSHKSHLISEIKDRLNKVLDNDVSLNNDKTPKNHKSALTRLASLTGKGASLLPEQAILLVQSEKQSQLYTILRNSAHSNISGLFNEDDRRLIEEDTISVLWGITGAYPDAFWKVDDTAIENFVDTIMRITSEDDYRNLMKQYGIRRTSNNFWQHSDNIHELFKSAADVEYGILDYNRIENR